MIGLKKFTALLCAAALTGSMMTVPTFGAQGDIRLQVNGEYVAMEDAAPEAKGGRTFVPVRAAFEALGADMSWDQSTKTVTAVRGDTTVAMTLDSTAATVTENGESYALTMDAAPYASGGRTYVPVRFVAQAFSCAVGWDSDARTVIIVDVDALFGDATFDRMDGWMAASLKEETLENARTTGTVQLKLTVSDSEAGKQTYPLKLDFANHATETKQQITVKTDFSDLAKLLLNTSAFSESGMSQAEFLKLCRAALEGRMDLASGKMYFNLDCPLMDAFDETKDSSKVWYLLDMDELMQQFDGPSWSEYMTSVMALPALMGEEMGFREMLCTMLASLGLNDAGYDYEALSMMAGVYCVLFSDQAMTKSGDDYIVDWKLEDGGTSVQMKITYQTRGERLVGMVMDLSAADESGDAMTMNMKFREENGNTSMAFRCNLFDEVLLDFDLSAKTVKATGEPATEPPAGAQIVDIFDFGVMPLTEEGDSGMLTA